MIKLKKNTEDMKLDLLNMDIIFKKKCNDLYNTGVKEIRSMRNTIGKLVSDCNKDIKKLRKQFMQIDNDKVKLKQYMIEIVSRAETICLDVNEDKIELNL